MLPCLRLCDTHAMRPLAPMFPCMLCAPLLASTTSCLQVRDACAKYYIAPDKSARQDDQVRRVLRDAEAAQDGGEGGGGSDDGSTVTPGGVILPSS